MSALEPHLPITKPRFKLPSGACDAHCHVFGPAHKCPYAPNRRYTPEELDRLPIGLPETLKGAPREALVRYYTDWYRPDLMAVIAVGDFDPAVVTTMIEAHFRSIPAAAAPKPRPRGPRGSTARTPATSS